MVVDISAYEYPRKLIKEYFSDKPLPSYSFWLNNYYRDFLNYIYFCCIQGGKNNYPINITPEKLLKDLEVKKSHDFKFNKILIGEAPPDNIIQSSEYDYFYNLNNPVSGPWIAPIENALFPNSPPFKNKQDFLIECAKAGFLLLDLFPYAIEFNSRATLKYARACNSAFGFNKKIISYPLNIMTILNFLVPFLSGNLTIGFGLASTGIHILDDKVSSDSFDFWLAQNKFSLNLGGPYLRVVSIFGPNHYGPDCQLLKRAGF